MKEQKEEEERERLSKLQKWILKKCLEEESIARRDLIIEYWDGPETTYRRRRNSTNSERVIMSRSIKRLRERDLIDDREWYGRHIKLTEKGRKTAQSL